MSLRTRVEQKALREEIHDGILEVKGYHFNPEDLDRELFEDEFGSNLDQSSIFTGEMYNETIAEQIEDIRDACNTQALKEMRDREEELIEFGIYPKY